MPLVVEILIFFAPRWDYPPQRTLRMLKESRGWKLDMARSVGRIASRAGRSEKREQVAGDFDRAKAADIVEVEQGGG